jgi:hypothetical protein
MAAIAVVAPDKMNEKHELAAQLAYKLADAMLEVRK